MKSLVQWAALSAALAMTAQPCLAAAPRSVSGPSTIAPSPVTGAVRFDLGQASHAQIAPLSMSLAASQQTAAEAQDQPKKRKGPGTTTWLIIGGVVLVVLIAAAVARAAPTPGPREGAFD